METSELYKTLNKYLYKSDGSEMNSALYPDIYKAQSATMNLDDGSGYLVGNINFYGGYLQSDNFESGLVGWKLNSDGTIEAVDAVLSGTITATAGQIGGTTISATTLTGGIIQTASSGQRIVMASSDNTLRFYDATAQAIGIGTTAAVAIIIDLNATTTNGVRVIGNAANDIGFQYTSTGNYDSTGLNLQFTGATNSATAININHDGSSGEGAFIDISAGAKGLLIQNSGAGESLYITSSAGKIAYLSCSSDSHIGIEMDYTGRQEALSIIGADADTTKSTVYISSNGNTNTYAALELNRSNFGPVLKITSSNSSNSNYSTGIEMNIASSGSSVECAFEFKGSEYDGTKTGVSGLTGVVRVVTSDGVGYVPVYDTAT